MSAQARAELVARLGFTDDTQASDLQNESLTNTDLIALLLDVTAYLETIGCKLYLTAVRSDHHDDSCLGPESHADGDAADCWPKDGAGAWLDARDYRFEAFLRCCAQYRFIGQIGLAGTAITPTNIVACGSAYFEDSGADHVHLSADDIA